MVPQEAPPKQKPKTLESTRDPDRTVVKPADDEVFRDEAEDEFAKFFSNEQVRVSQMQEAAAAGSSLVCVFGGIRPRAFFASNFHPPPMLPDLCSCVARDYQAHECSGC